MAQFQRRRHHYYNRLRLVIPLISAVSGVLLILFAFLSFLAPSPLDSDQLRHRLLQHSTTNKVDENDAVGVSKFRVPKRGMKSGRDIWTSRNSKFYHGCSNASNKFPKVEAVTHPNRYLAIATSGGLNQQRTGITDAVVAARILNATLVIPKLDQKSFWKDSSNFSEIFDVDQFISYLSKDVKIIKQLPRKGKKKISMPTMRVPRKCSERCYHNRVLPVLLKRHAVQLTKFDYRLANKLDTDLQKLRCRVNYHALKFTDPILEMGEKLVHRMRLKSKHYIALHLRFEPDMLAFSGCYYGGGEKEKKELGAIRRRWKTLHISNPDKERRHGKCPLTPEEVGLMLRALGYGSDVHIYVASGEVYGGEETLAPLKALFPNFYSKETIATKEELEPFSSFSSRMAALDFIVCDESDVFVTNNNGNMAKILAGRRRYFGHKPTIRPNAKKLYRLFLSKSNMTWEAFASGVRTNQRGFMGEPNEVRPGRGEFHENPSTCICEDSQAKAKKDSGPRKYGKGYDVTRKDDVIIDDQNADDEPEWPDTDDYDLNVPLEKGLFNGTVLDYDGATSDYGELEEMLSDVRCRRTCLLNSQGSFFRDASTQFHPRGHGVRPSRLKAPWRGMPNELKSSWTTKLQSAPFHSNLPDLEQQEGLWNVRDHVNWCKNKAAFPSLKLPVHQDRSKQIFDQDTSTHCAVLLCWHLITLPVFFGSSFVFNEASLLIKKKR